MVTEVFESKVCFSCSQEFRTKNGSDLCYSCHLHRISGGGAPEEGDFNSAHMAAGDLSDAAWRSVMAEAPIDDIPWWAQGDEED